MKNDGSVRGLNTAATLWGAAAVGASCGADLIPKAGLSTCFVVAVNTLLRPLVNGINRLPIDDEVSEVTYKVCVICEKSGQKLILSQLEDKLELSGFPTGHLSIQPFSGTQVQILAILISTSADPNSLDIIVQDLSNHSSVSQAFWSSSHYV